MHRQIIVKLVDGTSLRGRIDEHGEAWRAHVIDIMTNLMGSSEGEGLQIILDTEKGKAFIPRSSVFYVELRERELPTTEEAQAEPRTEP